MKRMEPHGSILFCVKLIRVADDFKIEKIKRMFLRYL